MESWLELDILPQPDDVTCGPTCLQAVYQYYGDRVDLETLIPQVSTLDQGGTLAVLLGCHALKRGYCAKLYTLDLQVFDPSWFVKPRPDLKEKLKQQMEAKNDFKLHVASRAYLDFLRLGGQIRFEDLTAYTLREPLKKGFPLLTGLSATYLYRTMRERDKGRRVVYDDVRGFPAGHFVVLCGYNMKSRSVRVADPLMPNPISEKPVYWVPMSRLINALMLGILTYDANVLVITPAWASKKTG